MSLRASSPPRFNFFPRLRLQIYRADTQDFSAISGKSVLDGTGVFGDKNHGSGFFS